jgi:hypothetical protein
VLEEDGLKKTAINLIWPSPTERDGIELGVSLYEE